MGTELIFSENEHFSRPPEGGEIMAVFRIEKTRDYTVMANHHLRNTALSLKAKGLLSLKQLRFLNGHPLIPIGYVQTRDAQHKKKTVNRYTPEGRAEIHKNLGVNTDTMIWLMRTPVLDKSIEFADNRISLFAAQYGRCAITGAELMENFEAYFKKSLKFVKAACKSTGICYN